MDPNFMRSLRASTYPRTAPNGRTTIAYPTRAGRLVAVISTAYRKLEDGKLGHLPSGPPLAAVCLYFQCLRFGDHIRYFTSEYGRQLPRGVQWTSRPSPSFPSPGFLNGSRSISN